MMSLITLLLNLTKIVTALQELFKVVGKNKGVTSVIVMCLVLVCGSCYLLAKNWVVNKHYVTTESRDKEVIYVNRILEDCGDRTAISISDISILKIENDKYWPGRFRIAKACDKRISLNCIINLKDLRPEIYRSNKINVALNSYNLFRELGKTDSTIAGLPRHFHLRDENDKQSLETVNFFPTITGLLKDLSWYEEGTLQDLWVTAILNKRSNVIYVLTILTAIPSAEGKCFDYSSKLIKLREFINTNNN